MQRVVPSRRPNVQPVAAPPASPWRTFTSISFILSVALVACRLLMSESIRSPQDPLAGGVAAPASPGPASGIFFDLLMTLPALLVLGRSAFDDEYRLRFNWSLIPMGLLAILAALSPLWAADKFAAAVSAAHLFAALVFLWSTAQLIRTWLGLRLIAGACLGVLLALTAVGYYYHTVEMADLRQDWQTHKDQILADRGYKPGTYEAQLFENRVLQGQPMGFSTSTNTYAALLVLLGIVSAGIVVQHVVDKDDWGWYVVPIFALATIGPLIHWTGCRAAYATPVIGGLILIAVGRFREPLARAAGKAYAAVIATLALVTAILIHHGMSTGNLWHSSLTFRWRYWVGSFRVLTAGFFHSPREWFHFFLGVGWENFGPYYLGRRLPVASEEIRDPHNFIVRVFVELGMVGGVLLLAWMLRFWWEITRPLAPTDASDEAGGRLPGPRKADPPRGAPAVMGVVAMIGAVAIIINIVISVDFASDGWYVFLEIARRGVFLCFLIIGLSLAALRLPRNRSVRLDPESLEVELDDRPAPWIAYATLAALATFLIHNLIEFSLFEPGPLFLFALLGGAAWGIHAGSGFRSEVPATLGSRHARGMATATLAAGAALWLAAAIFLATPVAVAEQLARNADADALKAVNLRPSLDPARGQALFESAANTMVDAWRRLPWNGDYAARAARLQIAAGIGQHDPRQVKQMLDAAVSADPSSVQSLAVRARFEFSVLADADAGRRDFDRALTLDPNNVRMRLDFARQLKEVAVASNQSALAETALLEYTRALDMDNLLTPDEIKRLTPRERGEAQKSIVELEALKASGPDGRSY